MRYLLGDLSEKEKTTLEEGFFSDDEEFEELEIAEEELIDRYVQNELSAEDHRQFKKTLLASPRLLERLEFARILATRVTSPASEQDDGELTKVVKPRKNKNEKTPWWNLFAPATGLSPAIRVAQVVPLALLLLLSFALVLVWTRSREQSRQLTAEQQRLYQLEKQIAEQRAKTDGLEVALTQTRQQKEEQEKLLTDYQQQLEDLRRQTPASILPFFLNPASGTRSSGDGERPLHISAKSGDVELQLNVEGGDYSRYHALLQDIDRKPILQRRLSPIRRGNRKYIPFRVATTRLTPGSYFVHVDGVTPSGELEDFSDYTFRVTTR